MANSPILPAWRMTPIQASLDAIATLPNLCCITPEPSDSEDVLRVKRQLADALRVNCGLIADRLELALNPKARRGATGYPYIPTEDKER